MRNKRKREPLSLAPCILYQKMVLFQEKIVNNKAKELL